jgi:hypothetical protein
MRRVLEARDIEDAGEIPCSVITADWREVASPGLSHGAAVVRCNEYRVTAAGACECSAPGYEIRGVAPLDVYLSAVTTRQAGELVKVESAFAHICERHAAVEQVLGEPPPRPLPQSLRIDCQRIERDDQ